MCVLVLLNQDFPDPDGPTTVSKSLFHGLTRADNGHATVPLQVLQSIVLGAGRRDHRLLLVR